MCACAIWGDAVAKQTVWPGSCCCCWCMMICQVAAALCGIWCMISAALPSQHNCLPRLLPPRACSYDDPEIVLQL